MLTYTADVILNTVYKMDQEAYDRDCPPCFQSAPFVRDHGQVFPYIM